MSKRRVKDQPIQTLGLPTGWDEVADWYDGWVGELGSKHHRELAIPTTIELLNLRRGESVLDIGAGQGVLARSVIELGARYTGIDVSPRLIHRAKQYHGREGTFLLGDARRLNKMSELSEGEFDAVVFLLSIQDMNPLEDALSSASWALKSEGRVVLFMLHPCFHVPRQSGWGWDKDRRLQYRRVDRYLTPLPVPMKSYGQNRTGVTITFHRPLQDYINGLASCGLLVDCVREIPSYKRLRSVEQNAKAINLAHKEIPLFIAIRARKLLPIVSESEKR